MPVYCVAKWRGREFNEGPMPLLFCPDTVYDELKSLIFADASARLLNVKPLSPAGLRTKVSPAPPLVPAAAHST